MSPRNKVETHYLSINSRQEYFSTCPRALSLPPLLDVRCEGYKISKLPMYAMYGPQGNHTDEEVAEARAKARCKLGAQYLYMHEDGNTVRVCGDHLITLLQTAEHYDQETGWYTAWRERLAEALQ